MIGTRRGILLVLVAVAVIFFLWAIGEQLGNWTDQQPRGVATLVSAAWDVLLLGLAVAIIVAWRRRSGSGNSR